MDYQQIPTDVPVKLLRIYHGKTGNVYMPGNYEPGQLPLAAYNTFYVTPLVAITRELGPVVMEDSNINNGSFKVEDLVEKKESPGVTEEISINRQVKNNDKHIKPTIHKVVKAPAVKINSADTETLINLNGVGKATARKVLELREQSGFIDYEDLNGRVPLAVGKDWTAYNIDFS